ncbi:DUF4440 domain-containing protein [Hyphomonas atlantica corrig.]|uniref:DUF4440 domain-containing protein n=1 Tax=Hyphomonas atlantica TaxID=1280948 RepID=UPI0023568A0B|nr:DUF4440 domain-containing protein [Hyphomonas atlantica]
MLARSKLPLVGLLILLGACTDTSAAPAPDLAQEEAVLRALKSDTWPGIYAANDADALAAFLADDFVLIGGGVRTKADEVDWMREHSWSAPEDFRFEVDDVIFLTPDSALVYGRGLSTRETEDGTPCQHSYTSSNTLRRTADGWHAVSSHVSDATCAPDAAED